MSAVHEETLSADLATALELYGIRTILRERVSLGLAAVLVEVGPAAEAAGRPELAAPLAAGAAGRARAGAGLFSDAVDLAEDDDVAETEDLEPALTLAMHEPSIEPELELESELEKPSRWARFRARARHAREALADRVAYAIEAVRFRLTRERELEPFWLEWDPYPTERDDEDDDNLADAGLTEGMIDSDV